MKNFIGHTMCKMARTTGIMNRLKRFLPTNIYVFWATKKGREKKAIKSCVFYFRIYE